MKPSLLITECLQNDFVQPIGRYDPLPNRLHVGFAEALRLMGEDPAHGPVARTLRWAGSLPDDQLRLIHIRDWHDPADPQEAEHLQSFGRHCLRDTAGAELAFAIDAASGKHVAVIDSPTLNDFRGTGLERVLAPYADGAHRVGLIGVWTEAKIGFLAYELRTRYPRFELAVCSALTASSSRQHHFAALDQLERILGVRVLDSVGGFIEFLGGSGDQAPLPDVSERHPEIETQGLELTPDDRTLVRYLFRQCRRVALRGLSGGFSGNVVAGTRSVDLHGHEQVPHVLKIGPRAAIGQERVGFERIQEVLGNNAPQVADFADWGDRGAIKYRYASMGGGFSSTFQKQYLAGVPLAEIRRILDTVFGEQLMRLYQAATSESCDLLRHYAFDARWAGSVRRSVERVLGQPAAEATVEPRPGVRVANVCRFYEETLSDLPRRPPDSCHIAFVHGDLNGANIVLDTHGNVWLIDFFHTRRAHVLMDLIKLENDLLYIYTGVDTDADLRDACLLTDRLFEVRDLGVELPPPPATSGAAFRRAWDTLGILRAYVPALVHSDRDPFQLWVGQLRYAVHTLSFDESGPRQKRWALYTAGRCVERITDVLHRSTGLRLDWLDARWTEPGRLALTQLPGRRDDGRTLDGDLDVLASAGVGHVLCLATTEELARYGVEDLPAACARRGWDFRHLPILDQKVPSIPDMTRALAWVDAALRSGSRVVVHCVGGLGRSGTAAACLLRTRGAAADEAVTEVRRARSPRAVETAIQLDFVRSYPSDALPPSDGAAESPVSS